MPSVLNSISTRRTPQSERANAAQVKNSAGGYAFQVDDLTRLRRFLTLGADGGTYYAGAKQVAKDNAEVVLRMAEADHKTLVDTIVDVSVRGAAPKVDPAIFALAIACSHGDPDERGYALGKLSDVCRTGTHLFQFAGYVEQFRGWGRSLRRAVADWYTGKPLNTLAYQAVKYRQREGWTHRDLLRLSHPAVAHCPEMAATFEWICRGTVSAQLPDVIRGFVLAQSATSPEAWAKLTKRYRLSWEMLPDAALTERAVWDAILENGMPQTALMRQLPRLTRLGMLPNSGGLTSLVCAQLADPERLAKARVHPVSVLVAQRTYACGQSARGESSWTPTRDVVDALDAAFYAAFGAVESAGKRTMLALDVSVSMMAPIANMPLTCRDASAALALVQMATEPGTECVGFTSQAGKNYWQRSTGLTPLNISPRQRLDDAIRTVSNLPFGGTDCSLPMAWAEGAGREFDTFVVYTDNETWAGAVHPHQALRSYRENVGIDARLIVVGMTATQFSIADPDDAGMLDVAGFDSAVPNLISEFSRGAI